MNTLDKCREVEQSATPGEWNTNGYTVWDGYMGRLGEPEESQVCEAEISKDDAALITLARNTFPETLELVDKYEQLIEYIDQYNGGECDAECSTWTVGNHECDCIRKLLIAPGKAALQNWLAAAGREVGSE